MGAKVNRFDTHFEEVGDSIRAVSHPFESDPQATQAVLFVGGEGVLRAGDSFTNEGVRGHLFPLRGRFVRRPSGKGRFVEAGQATVLVEGVTVQVASGELETCCEIRPRAGCEEAVLRDDPGLLTIEGAPVLLARKRSEP